MGNAQQAQTAGPILALGVVPAKSLVPAHTLTVTCDKMDRFNLGSASRRSRKNLRLSNGNRAFTCACLSTGKAILVAGDAEGYIYIYRTEGAELLQIHKAHEASITVLHWNRRTENSPERLLSGCRNGIVKLWDLGSTPTKSVPPGEAAAKPSQNDNAGSLLSGRGRSFVVDVPTPVGGSPPGSPRGSRRRMSAPRIPPSKVASLAYDGEVGRVYIGYANGSIKSFNTNTGAHIVSNDTAHRSEISQIVVARVDPSILPILDRHVLDTIMHLDIAAGGSRLDSDTNSQKSSTKDFTGSILISASKDGRLKGWHSSLENKAPLFDYDIDVSILLPSTHHGGDIVFGGTANGEIFAWQVSRAGLVTLKKIVHDSLGSIVGLNYNHTLDVLCIGTDKGYAVLSDKISEDLEYNKRTHGQKRLTKQPSHTMFPGSNQSTVSPTKNDGSFKFSDRPSARQFLRTKSGENSNSARGHRRRRSNSFTDDTVDIILEKLVHEVNNNAEQSAKPNGDKGEKDRVVDQNNEKYNRTKEEWIAISQLYSAALKLSKFKRTKEVISNANERMKQWFYNKTSDVDHDLSVKQQKLLKSHQSLVDENVRSKRWNDRRTNMIEELERRHALEKKQLMASLDEEEAALESALPEARRLMAQASQKLKSSYAEARAFCKAEAAHLAQKTLRTIAKREGTGLPIGDDQSNIPPGSPKEGNNYMGRDYKAINDGPNEFGPGTKVKGRFIIFNRRVTSEADENSSAATFVGNVFEALDILKKRRVIVKCFPPQLPLRTDLKHPALIPLVDLYATPQYTYVVNRWVDWSLASYVQMNQTNDFIPVPIVADVLYRVLEGLKYIHSKDLIHREIRPSSIFLLEVASSPGPHASENKPQCPKAFLEHFGVMKALDGMEANENGASFAAPETFGYSAVPSSDIWSVGCVMAWLLQTPVERATTPLFSGKKSREVLTSISQRIGLPKVDDIEDILATCRIPKSGKHILLGLVDGTYDTINKRIAAAKGEPATLGVRDEASLTPEARRPLERCVSSLEKEKGNSVAKDLLEKMICWRPNDRISIQDALQHDFFKKVRSRYEQKKRDSERCK